MTDQEINVAIAELCGWKQSQNACGDLNVMHDAEKVLINEQVETYETALTEVFYRGDRCCDFSLYPNDRIWHATTRQRAEAFLRVHGKWKE